MPFTAAHMASSRTPKNTFRPAGSAAKCAEFLKIVFVDAVKSAAPPISSGTASKIAFITCWPALRVAMGFSVPKLGIAFSHPAFNAPDCVRSNSAAGSGNAALYPANSLFHSASEAAPRFTASRQLASASSGT